MVAFTQWCHVSVFHRKHTNNLTFISFISSTSTSKTQFNKKRHLMRCLYMCDSQDGARQTDCLTYALKNLVFVELLLVTVLKKCVRGDTGYDWLKTTLSCEGNTDICFFFQLF